MTGHDRDTIAAFLSTVLGDPDDPATVPGYVFLCLGHRPTLTDTGAVKYDHWTEQEFSWPRQAAQAIAAAADADADAFFTPCRSENPLRKRAKARPVPVRWLWADLDNPDARSTALVDQYQARGAVVVESGSAPGRVHLYLPLEEPAPPAEVEALNRRLAHQLGADPAVGSARGVLRVAGTLNRKPAARGDAPGAVVFHPGTGAVFSVAELDEELPEAPPRPAGDAADVDPEPVEDDQLDPELVEVVAEPVARGMDRSERTYHLVNLCRRLGLTQGQALELAGRHAPSVDKYGARLAAEVARCWAKAVADPDNGTGGGPGAGPSTEGDTPRKRGPESVATQLVRLATEGYRFLCDDTGRAYAVPLDGPAIARPIDAGAGGLRAELARDYYERTGRAASKTALADAANALTGMAARAPAEPLGLRSVVVDPATVLVDLGRPDGAVVEVTPAGWRLLDRSPVVFIRTELTGVLPIPERGNGADALRQLVNVPADAVPLVLGWLVATFLVDAPRPILALFGEQGTGKSTAARTLVALVDASPVPLRAAPSSLEAWIVAAAGSSVVALDNLSKVEPWFSDAMCRAATGEGLVRRKLYTDGALAVTTLRRSVILTSIDTGALRGDLAERLLAIELERITGDQRRTDAELAQALDAHHAVALGHVLDALAGVLAQRPNVPADLDLPRMADFGRVLAALDRWAGTDALAAYLASLDTVAADVVEGDPLAAALRRLAESGGFDGTAAELLDRLAPWRPERGFWPTTPRQLGGAVRRAAPALRTVGVTVETRRTGSARLISVWPASDGVTVNDGLSYLSCEGRKGNGQAAGPKPPEAQGSAPSPTVTPSQPDDGAPLCIECGRAPRGSFTPWCVDCAAAPTPARTAPADLPPIDPTDI